MIRLTKEMLLSDSPEFARELSFRVTFAPGLDFIRHKCFGISQDKQIRVDPACMQKYIIRKNLLIGPDDITLDELKLEDKYSPQKSWVFNGTFEYCKTSGGFLPMGENRNVSSWMKKVYDEREGDRIQNAWNRAKRYLSNGSILIHESTDQHVYFMRNLETNEIKIGISIHPEVRRLQLKRQEGADLEILHIIPSAGREEERRLHQKFSNFRLHGEWFEPHESLVGYISSLRGEEAQQ